LPRKDTAAYAAFAEAASMVRRDPRAAAQRFAAAAQASPGFYAAWFNAGVAAEAAGDVAAAEQHYRATLRVRPDYGPALTNLATLLSSTGKDGEAQKVVENALRTHPEAAGPHLAAADRALRTRDLAGAESEARLALGVDERNVGAMLVMAQVFRAQGRVETARFAVDNALALEPGNALLHLERGHILLKQDDKQEALFAYERAARLRPTLAEALEPYGRLLLERGFAPEALTTFQALVQRRPQSAVAHLHLGNALRGNKQYEPAEAAYKKALELDAYLDEVHFNLGVLYIDNNVGGGDELARLERGLAALRLYQSRAKPDAATKARLAEYIDATDKRVVREQKRRERDRKRQADDAAKAAAAPPPGPAATEAPPSPAPAAPPPPAPGAADDK
jgi:tetratricopeptide (TPR) repeat protein